MPLNIYVVPARYDYPLDEKGDLDLKVEFRGITADVPDGIDWVGNYVPSSIEGELGMYIIKTSKPIAGLTPKSLTTYAVAKEKVRTASIALSDEKEPILKSTKMEELSLAEKDVDVELDDVFTKDESIKQADIEQRWALGGER